MAAICIFTFERERERKKNIKKRWKAIEKTNSEKYGDCMQRQTLFGSLTFIMSVSLVLLVRA